MTILRLIRNSIILALLVALPAVIAMQSGRAQSQNKDGQKSQDPATLRIETELVQIDAVLADKQ